MARPLRIQYPGAFYHITSRGNERKAIFKSKADRERFLCYLKSAADRYGAVIHVYCLMDNHYHLLLETPLGNLPQILQHINGSYTAYFNTKRKRFGHLFQGRYKAILVEKDAYCKELSRYIHLNPVRAGLVSRAGEYRWSSYRYYVGKEKDPPWLESAYLLGYFGPQQSSARKNYREFVEDDLQQEGDDPLEDVFASTILGSEGFISWVKDTWIAKGRADIRNIPVLRDLIVRPSLADIEASAVTIIGKDHRIFKSVCLFVSHQYGGFRLKEIGAYYGMRGAAVSQASRRFKQRIAGDERAKEIVTNILQSLKGVEC